MSIQMPVKLKKCKNFAECHNTFKPFRTTDRFCSPQCAHKAQPPVTRTAIHTKQFKAAVQRREPVSRIRAKERARERDHYQCLLRGVVAHICDSRREAHHIIYLSENGVDKDWNLITLCGIAHHDIAHKNKGLQAQLLEIVSGANWYDVAYDKDLPENVKQKLSYLLSTRDSPVV
jgi:hypothetical protein